MIKAFPRVLLALSAVILIAGGLMHARAFDKTLSALAASNLDAFYANSLNALWLIDSATLMTLAVVFGLVAARPHLTSRPVVILLAIVPGATVFFLYKFIGNFVPAHMLLASAIAAVVGGIGFGSARSTIGSSQTRAGG